MLFVGSPGFIILKFTLVSLHDRVNLSPFTKDFRGEEQHNESIDLFFKPYTEGYINQTLIRMVFKYTHAFK